MNLTIVYHTCRDNPEIGWFFQSLLRQIKHRDEIRVIVVTMRPLAINENRPNLIVTQPKPTIWQGPHRITKRDWWAASNSRNTGICLCETDWIAFCDDRSVLGEDWLTAVRHAQLYGPYAACGAYEKWDGIVVENGVIVKRGNQLGEDDRLKYVQANCVPRGETNPFKCPGQWSYGCSLALPLEWALTVNGFDETCDSSSGEDYIFGLMVENNGFPLKYDTRLLLVEDRSENAIGKYNPAGRGTDNVLARQDKGISPQDKSHALLEKLRRRKRAMHFGCDWDLRAIRKDVLAGKPFPIPTGPTVDWFDNQPIREFE